MAQVVIKRGSQGDHPGHFKDGDPVDILEDGVTSRMTHQEVWVAEGQAPVENAPVDVSDKTLLLKKSIGTMRRQLDRLAEIIDGEGELTDQAAVRAVIAAADWGSAVSNVNTTAMELAEQVRKILEVGGVDRSKQTAENWPGGFEVIHLEGTKEDHKEILEEGPVRLWNFPDVKSLPVVGSNVRRAHDFTALKSLGAHRGLPKPKG